MSTNQRLDDIRSRLATVTSTIALGAADRDRASRFEIAPFEALHAAGLLAYGLPAEYGGAGRSIAEVGTIIREVARADASVGLVLSMYFISHVGAARQRHWSADLHQRLVADALKRPALINGAQSEPALGSPMRGGALQTRAERTSSGWRISGHKNFVTGSEGLSWFVVSAQTEQGQTGSWLVPGGSQVSIQKTWNNLGMRATASHDVIFEGVDVPENALIDLREPGQRPNSAQGFSLFSTLLNFVYLGVADAARDAAVHYVRNRAPAALGTALINVPSVQEKLGRLQYFIETATAINANVALKLDHPELGEVGANETGVAKIVVRENAVLVSDLAVQLAGGGGLAEGNSLARHHRDALCGRAHGPAEDIVLAGLARQFIDVAQ